MKRLVFVFLLLTAQLGYADCVLQANTADTGFAIGPFFDSTDGVTRETALTITSAEVILKKKDSTTFAAKNDATACTHRDSGWYTCPLNATDTNTEGNMIVEVEEAGSTGAWRECLVVGSGYYDLIDGTTSLLTSRQAGNALLTTIDAITDQDTISLTTGPSNDDALNDLRIYFVGGAEECERQITDYTGTGAGVQLDAICPNMTLQTNDTAYVFNGPSGGAVALVDTVVDGITSSIGTPADLGSGATVADNLIDIEGQTDDIGVAGAGLTAINLPDQTMDITGNLSGSVGSVTGHTAQTGDSFARLGAPAGASVSADIAANQTDLDKMMGTFLNCEVNTLNFAGSVTTFACILTDLDSSPVTQANGDLEGLQIVVTSGAQIREARFINSTTWDGANSELQLTISRALPATLADAVTVIIR